MSTRLVAAYLAIMLLGYGGSARAGRYCRRHCGAAIAACEQTGGRHGVCRRDTLRHCKRDRAVCSFTTTTSFFPTTTTLPLSGVVELAASNVQTLYEIGSGVPAAGSEFVALDVTIRNGGTFNVTPTTVMLHSNGLDYASFGAYYGPYPPTRPGACDGLTSVAPGGEITCGLVFQVQEAIPSGRLTLGPYFTQVTISSSEFTIPSATRPTASLTIDDVSPVDTAGYCTSRPGFTILQFSMTLTSHGASGLALNVYSLVVLADNARYMSGCGYLGPDPCDGSIGVPVDGTSACTAAFQVRDSVGGGTLVYDDGRYQASADFTLP